VQRPTDARVESPARSGPCDLVVGQLQSHGSFVQMTAVMEQAALRFALLGDPTYPTPGTGTMFMKAKIESVPRSVSAWDSIGSLRLPVRR
jgi:hypothetical protein